MTGYDFNVACLFLMTSNRKRASNREFVMDPNQQALFYIELGRHRGSHERVSTSGDEVLMVELKTNGCLLYEN